MNTFAKLILLVVAAFVAVGCNDGKHFVNGYRIVGYDQGGKPICRDWSGERVYDCDATRPKACDDPALLPADTRARFDRLLECGGIATELTPLPEWAKKTARVPGPLIEKPIAYLTPEDRAWLAWKSEARGPQEGR